MSFWTNNIWLDEVGRWPLAWPVTVGGVFCTPGFWNNVPERYHEVTDSKKLTSWQRSLLSKLILSHPDIISSTHSSSAKIINRYGIVYAIRRASMKVIWDLVEAVSDKLQVGSISILLDGKTDYGLRSELNKKSHLSWISLTTLINGDALVWQIGAASIVAKVQRDDYMINLSKKKKYRPYKFDRHKGYGTFLHRSVIAEYGLSDLHRKSFCRNIIIPS